MARKFIIFTVMILFLGAVPRAIEMINGNYLFGYDQGLFYLGVKKIVVEHKLALIGAPAAGGAVGFFQGPGWYYLLAIPFVLFAGNPYGGMVLIFLIGMATIAAAIFFLRKMFDERTALIGGLLLAISPAMIPQSRFIWPPFPIPLLSVFLLFFLYKVLEKKDQFLPWLAFTLGLMTHLETATAATLLGNLLIIFPFLVIKKMVSLRMIILSFGAIILTQLPLIIFDLRHNLLNLRGIIRLILTPGTTEPSFGEKLANRWGVFKENLLTTFPSADFWWPLLIFIIMGGVVLYLKNKHHSSAQKAFVAYLAISPVLLFLVFLKMGFLMWNWWILELHVYYCFLLAIILSFLWSKNFLKLVIGGLLFFLVFSFAKQTVFYYRNDFNDFGGVHKIKGKIQALDDIYRDASGKPFNLLIFSPPIYTYAYDYLLWWYGKGKYGYEPERKKEGTFYLLIEPDPHQPWTYKGWLETVIKTGKIVKTQELPSGFIIQKRFLGENER